MLCLGRATGLVRRTNPTGPSVLIVLTGLT